MQEQITFKLSEEFLQSTPDISTFSKELQLNMKAVENLLISYHFKTRGRVFNIQVDGKSLQLINENMAKFSVNYFIGQFNACADIDFTEPARMEILIDADMESREAILTGEYIPEREPDEF